jgi:hypothetical protein
MPITKRYHLDVLGDLVGHRLSIELRGVGRRPRLVRIGDPFCLVADPLEHDLHLLVQLLLIGHRRALEAQRRLEPDPGVLILADEEHVPEVELEREADPHRMIQPDQLGSRFDEPARRERAIGLHTAAHSVARLEHGRLGPALRERPRGREAGKARAHHRDAARQDLAAVGQRGVPEPAVELLAFRERPFLEVGARQLRSVPAMQQTKE